MTNSQMVGGRIKIAALAKKRIKDWDPMPVAFMGAQKPHEHGIIGCYIPVVFGLLGGEGSSLWDEWVPTLYGQVEVHRGRLEKVWAQYGLWESIDLTRYVCQ